MLEVRNEPAPKPIGTSGNSEEATEPEDDEYQSEESDEMDEVSFAFRFNLDKEGRFENPVKGFI